MNTKFWMRKKRKQITASSFNAVSFLVARSEQLWTWSLQMYKVVSPLQDTCQLHSDCFAWSFAPERMSTSDHHCYHVNNQDGLSSLALKPSAGAFAQTKGCSDRNIKDSKCAIEHRDRTIYWSDDSSNFIKPSAGVLHPHIQCNKFFSGICKAF